MKKIFKVVSALMVLAITLMFTGCPEAMGLLGKFNLTGKGTINGKVVYSNSSDSSDIVVSIEKTDGLLTESVRNFIQSADTDGIDSARSAASRASLTNVNASSNGSYSFTDLEPGVYTIYASSNNSKEKAVSTNVIVEGDKTTTADDMQLTATGTISGKVTLDGNARAGFFVIIPGTGIVDVTNEKGEYKLADVPAGTQYNLAVVYGTYTYFVTSTVASQAGKDTSANEIKLESSQMKNNLLKGNDGTDGIDGKDGKDAKDGIGINWLGAFESSEEIKEPKAFDAFFNSTDGCSYVYIGSDWVILARAGKDGADGKDGRDGRVTGTDSKSYVTAVATDKGIEFYGSILSNVRDDGSSTNASVEISIEELDSGIVMHQDWTKLNNVWSKWDLIYPLVEKGKEYTFYVKVSNTNFSLYEQFITIEATGGLGEYKVENVDDLKVEFDKDERIFKRTVEPKFTDNPNVKILANGSEYYLYRDKIWTYWVYNTYLWDDGLGEFNLKKQLPSWQNMETVEKIMSGHNYEFQIRTFLRIAGYSYNDTVYFAMNDSTLATGEWGGKLKKVYVITDPTGWYEKNYGLKTKFVDIPGEELKATEKDNDGKESTNVTKAIVINYGDTIEEPLNVPYTTTGESKFNGWMNSRGDKISFPYKPTTQYEYDDCTVDGEPVEFLDYLIPDLSVYFNATLMDGDKEFAKGKVEAGKGLVDKDKYENDGVKLIELYTDPELTKVWDNCASDDITLYGKWGNNGFTIRYREDARWSSGVFNVEDDWESIEVTFAPDTDLSRLQFNCVSDSLEKVESWGNSYYQTYPQIFGEISSVNFANELASVAKYGATKIVNCNIQNTTSDGFDVKVLSAVVTKKDGTKVNVKAIADWSSTIIED
ncbi:MAG: carboxypeptidase-like regulatory domain-containing protein [Treponema sp.]|nr:carboxypeptidase-like regulatory domain-containing protein [Treponema sp.]